MKKKKTTHRLCRALCLLALTSAVQAGITGSWYFTGARFEGSNSGNPQITRTTGTAVISQAGDNYTVSFQFPGASPSVTVPLTVSGFDYRAEVQLSIPPYDITRSVVIRDHGGDTLTINWADAGHEQESPYGGYFDMQKFSAIAGALTKTAASVADPDAWEGLWDYDGHLFEADDTGEVLHEDFNLVFDIVRAGPDTFTSLYLTEDDTSLLNLINGELRWSDSYPGGQINYEDDFTLVQETGEMSQASGIQLGGGRAVLLWFGQGTHQLTIKDSIFEPGSGPYPSLQYAFAEAGLMTSGSVPPGPPADGVTDTDSDGVTDLLEYAFNLDPAVSDRRTLTEGSGSSGLPAMRLDTSTTPARLRIEYVRRKNPAAAGINYQVQWSSNLNSWTTDAGPATVSSIDAVWERVVVSDPAPAAKRFGRVAVSLTDPQATAPEISTQPGATSVTSGGTATLTVSASGTGPFTYQWYQGAVGTTTTPVGTNSASFTTPALTATTTYWVRITNAAGTVDSGLATVTVATAPSITTQPTSTTITSGSTATLTVTAGGTAPLTYQWYQGAVGVTTAPVGTNSASFTTTALTSTTTYWVRVSNLAGSVDSALATVTVNQPSVAPSITTQPASSTITSGQTATLSVTASGTSPLTYQWYQGAVGVTTTPVGTNSATFTTPALTTTTTYWVRITNAAGSVDSGLATVTVATAPSITTHPASTTITSGSTATLTVSATGTAPLTYQWYQGAVGTTTTPVGTNSASFTTPTLTSTTTYWVRVSNSAGNVDSTLATVTVGGSTPAELALIPAGSFTMGRTSGDTDSDAPPVTVTVSAFYMGKNEVTKALWDEVRTWAFANGYTDLATGAGIAANHPVQTVSWWDVIKWCNARSQKEGLTPVYTVSGAVMKTGTTAPTVNWAANGYRLPTEAEWEKAARGGVSGKRFPWGTDTISHSQANYYADASYSYDSSGSVNNNHPTYATGLTPYTSPVGSFAANGYGLNDMAGNVFEWCWDWYGAYVNGATDPRGAASGASRVFRGGSWILSAYYCRAAYRNSGFTPANQISYIGFRIARSSVP